MRHPFFGPTVLAIALATQPAIAQTVVTDEAACRWLTRHEPAGDVAYQPGIDVDGNPVVSADLNPTVIDIPTRIVIPITVDLAERYGLPPDGSFKAEAIIGEVIYDNGSVTFNGQPITDEDTRMFAAWCRRNGYR